MKRLLLSSATVLALVTSASTRKPPAGYRPANGNAAPMCGSSCPVMGARAWICFVIGAWFDNHYTVRRGQLFYNCIRRALLSAMCGHRRSATQTANRQPEHPSDRRCNDSSERRRSREILRVGGDAMPYDPRMLQMAQMGVGMMGPQQEPRSPRSKQWWEQPMPGRADWGQPADPSKPDRSPIGQPKTAAAKPAADADAGRQADLQRHATAGGSHGRL